MKTNSYVKAKEIPMSGQKIKINRATMEQELIRLLHYVFQLPEVHKVQIKNTDIVSMHDIDTIREGIEEGYHDTLSDIDVGIYVTLHKEDIDHGHGYCGNQERIGLTRDNYMGLTYSCDGSTFQMYRVIMKNGVRFDIGFYITEDDTTPIYHIPKVKKEAVKDPGHFWPRWDLDKADSFWFIQIQALAKLLRGDYLIADHLSNIQINETLLAQMIERDNKFQTNYHRYGYKETLDYRTVDTDNIPYLTEDDTYNIIAKKLYSTAVSYDRLVKKLNPDYVERCSNFLRIWDEYQLELGNEDK